MNNILFISGIIFAIGIIIIVISVIQNYIISIDNIKIEIVNLPRELIGFKIAHISDVHLPYNAANINTIISKVREQEPDIIVMTGDIVEDSVDVIGYGLDRLCKGLASITDTYAVTGNHEFCRGNVNKCIDVIVDNNIKFVDNKIELYSKRGKNIIITGLACDVLYKPGIFEGISKYQDLPIILLAHRPDLFDSFSNDSHAIRPNIVFAGHAHGGQVRIPFINRGLFSPNQGLFPNYTSGNYILNNNVNMVVSRGLKNCIMPLKINNAPHIPVIELFEKKVEK